MASRCCQVTISDELGLHARPAMAFVELASRFESRIRVSKNGTAVNGKSIMEIMLLAATRGTQLEIEADGPDADVALEALKTLVENGFDED